MHHRLAPVAVLAAALAAGGCSGGGSSLHPAPSSSVTPAPTATATPAPFATPAPGASATVSTGLFVAAPYANAFTQVTTTLTVPNVLPQASGSVVIGAELTPQAGAPYAATVGSGVLAAALAFGPACVAGAPETYASWYAFAGYDDTTASTENYGCHGSAVMNVAPGDVLSESLAQSGTVWSETVTDATSGNHVSYAVDLQGETQNYLYFLIDGDWQNPTPGATFSNTTFTTSTAFAGASDCTLQSTGAPAADSQSTPALAGATCSIQTIVLATPAPSATGAQSHARYGSSFGRP